jgi:hypothetical protein
MPSCHFSWVPFVFPVMERDEEMSTVQEHASPVEPLEARRQREREVVHAFLSAARGADFEALLALLDPDVVLRADSRVLFAGASRAVRGARAVVEQVLLYSRLARFALPALVDGAVGLVMAPRGTPFEVMGFTVTRSRIVEIEIFADPARLRRLDLAVLHD